MNIRSSYDSTTIDPTKVTELLGTPSTMFHEEAIQRRSLKMQFALTGFTQDIGFRVFAFEGTGADRTRTAFKVRADLALARKYGIPTQELPFLCLGLLERLGEGDQQHAITYTEENMRVHAQTCADARNLAILKKKPVRRPVTSTQTGIGWRVAQPQRS